MLMLHMKKIDFKILETQSFEKFTKPVYILTYMCLYQKNSNMNI